MHSWLGLVCSGCSQGKHDTILSLPLFCLQHSGNIVAAKKRLKREDVKGEITLDNVEFHYSRSADPSAEEAADDVDIAKTVFAGCNLTMKAGQTIALGK